jgi:hypothetical protein
MLEASNSAVAGRSDSHAMNGALPATSPELVMRPRHFFSNSFELEAKDANTNSGRPLSSFHDASESQRLRYRNRLLTLFLFAVSAVLYWALFAAG